MSEWGLFRTGRTVSLENVTNIIIVMFGTSSNRLLSDLSKGSDTDASATISKEGGLTISPQEVK